MRDALAVDEVLAFEPAPRCATRTWKVLLGIYDREPPLAASEGVLRGDALALLQLAQAARSTAPTTATSRQLLLDYRELLLVKLAPESSPLLHAVLPEELERLSALARELSEEDLLRALDLLTRIEGELRHTTDPRVALDLALLKLVQLRRLMPVTELVARVEQLGGAARPLDAGPPRPAPSRPAPVAPCRGRRPQRLRRQPRPSPCPW